MTHTLQSDNSDWHRLSRIIMHAHKNRTGRDADNITWQVMKPVEAELGKICHVGEHIRNIKAGRDKLTWELATCIFYQYPLFDLRWLMGVATSVFAEPLTEQISGTWSLYETYYCGSKDWLTYQPDIFGPVNVVFDERVGIVEINTVQFCSATHFSYYPTLRILSTADYLCYIIALTPDRLETISFQQSDCRVRKCVFRRASLTDEIDEKPLPAPATPVDIQGEWLIDYAQTKYASGIWRKKPQNKRPIGSRLWQIDTKTETFQETQFGHNVRKRYIGHSYDEHTGILHVHFNPSRDLYVRFEYDNEKLRTNAGNDNPVPRKLWAYVLHNRNQDYTESRLRLHLVQWNPEAQSAVTFSLIWVGKRKGCRTMIARIPKKLLKSWYTLNPKRFATLIADGKLLTEASKYTADIYAGTFVFLHYYTIYHKTEGINDKTAPELLYQQYNEIIGLWLSLHARGDCTPTIYPFDITTYPSALKALRDATNSATVQEWPEPERPQPEKPRTWLYRLLH